MALSPAHILLKKYSMKEEQELEDKNYHFLFFYKPM